MSDKVLFDTGGYLNPVALKGHFSSLYSTRNCFVLFGQTTQYMLCWEHSIFLSPKECFKNHETDPQYNVPHFSSISIKNIGRTI